MSISGVLNRWLNRLYKIIAIFLVLIAVLTSAFRLFLPYVHNYRQNFQDYINTTNQTNIVIGALSMNWHGAGPILIVRNVLLLDTPKAKASIEHLTIEIDVFGSIIEQRLIYQNLVLKGVHLDVEQDLWLSNKTAAIIIQDVKLENTENSLNAISNLCKLNF